MSGYTVEMRRPIPRSMDEWGPDCVRCGDPEYRIDGYCSPECRDFDELEREIEKLSAEKKDWQWALAALQGVKEATREWANSSNPNRDVVLLRRLGPEFDAFDERGEPHPVEWLKP